MKSLLAPLGAYIGLVLATMIAGFIDGGDTAMWAFSILSFPWPYILPLSPYSPSIPYIDDKFVGFFINGVIIFLLTIIFRMRRRR